MTPTETPPTEEEPENHGEGNEQEGEGTEESSGGDE